MFSARKRTLGEKPGRTPWTKTRRRLSSGLKGGLKPRVGMRVWLTAMFVLVTAFADEQLPGVSPGVGGGAFTRRSLLSGKHIRHPARCG